VDLFIEAYATNYQKKTKNMIIERRCNMCNRKPMGGAQPTYIAR